MAGFQCPYCSMIMSLSDQTVSTQFPSFSTPIGNRTMVGNKPKDPSVIKITFYRCPNCGQYTINASGYGANVEDVNVQIRPHSLAKQFPKYIPEAIRRDYEEACAIVNLSPKASATLSRRCLQGMIRDFFQISKNNLFEEINAIKPKIPAEQWAVLDGIRQIGNIGAHMEKDINLIVDIEPNEAEKLIKLIELLLNQWYVERNNQNQLYADIIGINRSKQNERKKSE